MLLKQKLKSYCLKDQGLFLTDPRETTHMRKGRQRVGHSLVIPHCLLNTEKFIVHLD